MASTLFCFALELKRLPPDMSQRETYIANLMREDCIRILRNQKPLLLVDGAEEIDVDLWIGVSLPGHWRNSCYSKRRVRRSTECNEGA